MTNNTTPPTYEQLHALRDAQKESIAANAKRNHKKCAEAQERFDTLLRSSDTAYEQLHAAAIELRAARDILAELDESDVAGRQHAFELAWYPAHATDYLAAAQAIIDKQESAAPGWLSQKIKAIAEATKAACAVGTESRDERLIARDQQEEEMKLAEENLAAAKRSITTFRTNPCLETLNPMIGATMQLKFAP